MDVPKSRTRSGKVGGPLSPTSGTLMHAKPFLVTYVKVLGLLTALTLVAICGLYFTGSSHTNSASPKPNATTAAPRTPSPPTTPSRTAPSFSGTHVTAMDFVRPTRTGQPTVTPPPRPKPKPTATRTRPTPRPTHTRTATKRSGLSVAVQIPGLPRVGVDVSRSAPRTGSARTYARSVLSFSQYTCLDRVITRESGWNVYATNPTSGAYGLGQALPGSKMASMGSDWRTNGVTQIRWAISYMKGRYGSPCGAWSFWQSHRWY